jgi:N-acetylneuraminate synthase
MIKNNKIKIGSKIVSKNLNRTYFIADIAANHDGNLARAKKLIRLAKKNGADAVKFQHFKAETIVSDYGFKKIGKLSHQNKWKKSVYQTYLDASINPNWTSILKKEADRCKIDFMTAPYDLNYVDMVNKYICAYKIGSGDITWKEIINKIAKKKKPVILATGASNLTEVRQAVKEIIKYNKKLVLMQCNTNYTDKIENFNFINLNVLKIYEEEFKNKIIVGLSDHTKGHITVLGAIALGAKVIEKHFTDNNNRMGPDHKFSMNPKSWALMIRESRLLEKSLGYGIKRIEKNEKQSSVIQRRSIWANENIDKGKIITRKMLSILRPCPKNSISIFNLEKIIGKKSKKNLKKFELITKKCLI